VENSEMTGSALDKNKIKKLTLFTDASWFTLSMNKNRQNG
jgi:hypothetical protein